MHDVSQSVAPEIQADIGALISNLQALGWRATNSHYDAKVFGNWYVDLESSGSPIRLIKDRSQYMVDRVTVEVLKAAGLWKAFNDLEEFQAAVTRWAEMLHGDGESASGCT
jgi:hypothetical protein